MLTGARPFAGEDLAETIGAVIHKEPAWTGLPAATPAAVRTALRCCLEKDPKQRVRDIGDVVLALNGIFQTPATPQPVPVARWGRVAVLIAVGVVIAGLSSSAVWLIRRSDPPRVTRTAITASGLSGGGVAVTPDGSRVVFVANNGARLLIRPLDTLDPAILATGRQIRAPFVSPDGQWVGFWDGPQTLRRVPITGGPSVTLTRVTSTGVYGSTWLPDDTIVFAAGTGSGLQRVSAAGGTPAVLTRPDRSRGEAEHAFPAALPDGRAVLFTIVDETGGMDAAQVAGL